MSEQIQVRIRYNASVFVLNMKKTASIGDLKKKLKDANPNITSSMHIYKIYGNERVDSDDGVLIGTLIEENESRIELTIRWPAGSGAGSIVRYGAGGSSTVSLRHAEGRTGLSNQGATCYLNSLLQSLYMTPEFRSALYEWSFDESTRKEFITKIKERNQRLEAGKSQIQEDSNDIDISVDEVQEEIEFEFDLQTEEKFLKYKEQKESKSIPRQLQLLFATLQLAEGRSASTKPLTNSFGWTQGEAFTQHDVQELCRVLFDALENVWKGTDKENLINDFYQGHMKDFVRCTVCGHESSRQDKFLDIPLVIKGFGETKAVSSIHEALGKFTDVERLEGDNQYFCESCDCKVDADKGLSFVDFPYLLMLQLKRFDFDYMTMRRIKLNDRVSFPEILDMNLYVEGNEEMRKAVGVIEEYEFGDESRRQELIEEALTHGPYVYELYSVLIHGGSALGGHYYAYIKSLEKNEWYNFNDSSVTHLKGSSVESTFGGSSRSGGSSRTGMGGMMGGMMGRSFESGTNAYMLMYRRYDPIKNQQEPSLDMISDELRLAVNELKNKMKSDTSSRNTKHAARVSFFYKDKKKENISVDRELTIAQIMEQALNEFDIAGQFAEDCIRIRDYNVHFGIPGKIYDNTSTTLEELRKYIAHFMIETKSPEEEFEEYDESKMTLKLRLFNTESESFDEAVLFPIDKNANLGELRDLLAEKYPEIPRECQLLSKSDFNKLNAVVLKNDQKSLKPNLKIYEGVTLYLEEMREGTTEDDYVYNYMKVYKEGEAVFPLAFEEITIQKNSITVNFTSLDSEDFDHSVTIDKNKNLEDLKEMMAEVLDVSCDEFKIMKGLTKHKHELRDLEKRIAMCHINNNEKLTLIKGTPLGKDDALFKFSVFKVTDEVFHIEDLFQESITKKLPVIEAKAQFLEKFKQWKENPEDPEKPFDESLDLGDDPSRLRFSIITAGYPTTVLSNSETMETASKNLIYTIPQIAVSLLPEGETEEKEKTNIPVYVQQFHPSDFTLGPKMNFYLNYTQEIEDLRKEIREKTGVQTISLSPCERWDRYNVLDIPKFSWYAQPQEEKKKYTTTLRYVRSLRPRDGYVMIFKDAEEELGKIDEETKKSLLERYKTSKPASSIMGGVRRAERQLKINQGDIDIDDLFEDENLAIEEQNVDIIDP
eukprot:TRINITY_DN5607_c0_g1_i1.p1 TRINITY_DN5607_c0_g1~~TRINITY_DN5607_c0_g1_i1.p1  ORF type:complete len:1164 (+),score=303.45 TRINITY_DN5607_c0_g1_i1:400-3891(+)